MRWQLILRAKGGVMALSFYARICTHHMAQTFTKRNHIHTDANFTWGPAIEKRSSWRQVTTEECVFESVRAAGDKKGDFLKKWRRRGGRNDGRRERHHLALPALWQGGGHNRTQVVNSKVRGFFSLLSGIRLYFCAHEQSFMWINWVFILPVQTNYKVVLVSAG